MQDRRNFLRQLGLGAASLGIAPLNFASQDFDLEEIDAFLSGTDIQDLISDEEFWYRIRQLYPGNHQKINFNNAGVSPSSKLVEDAFIRAHKFSNEIPAYNMWRVMNRNRNALRNRLAEMAGCEAEEIAIQRNTTEALGIVVYGLSLEKGDEIVLGKYDYPNMRMAWEQRQQRDGISLKYVDIQLDKDSDDQIAEKYVSLFNKNTKVVHLTHIVNYTGRIMPVERIAKIAKSQNIQVIVDGAQSFAHIDFKVKDLHADYFGTSLHKWLGAPFGTGFLYVKKERITDLYALFPPAPTENDKIVKFEVQGTRSFPAEFGILDAIDFNDYMGMKLKEERLRYLSKYWHDRLKEIQGFTSFCIDDDSKYAGIRTFRIADKNHQKLTNHILAHNSILTTYFKYEAIEGIRVSPNVYSTSKELDIFVDSVKQAIDKI